MAAPVQKTSGGNAVFHNYHNQFAHVTDANERRRLALAEVDKAPFGWHHVRVIVVAGTGFFTDAYDIFAINLVTGMLGLVYWDNGHIPEKSDTAIKVSTSAGTVVGQLGFGWLADAVGRKKIYGLELMVIIVATLAQCLTAHSYAMNFVGIMIFWRVIMGIGIGGDYPLSSVITSEFSTTKWRGAMMGAVFAMQGMGQFAAALVALIVTAAFKSQTEGVPNDACGTACRTAVDRMWRIIIGFGAIPAAVALYYRLTIPETPRYTFDVEQDAIKGAADATAFTEGEAGGDPDEIQRIRTMAAIEASEKEPEQTPKASWADFFNHYGQWRYGKILLGTAGSWFLLDVAFYGLGLNNSVILNAIGYSAKDTVYETLFNNATGNLILTCAGAIPGYWTTVFTVDTVGRKPIQLMGFIILTMLFCVIGFDFHNLSEGGLLALYVLCQFFFNFGPNATTFIVPGEIFPTRYRSTSHGISAASGKIGAIIAQVLIGPLRVRGNPTPENPSPWLNHVMQIFALFMFLGIFTTLLIPESKRKTLEQLCLELYDEGSEFEKPEEREARLNATKAPWWKFWA
ncbi:phosphate permease [Ascodesmis nigricans]|uniref:Phosphate permease n=1 Tax=Ascodesmis nigricans TaxID=341454 RepID=A0A4S2N891_9PEZI|nr:phosphate permease [Ascodesmis nigricans]